MAGRGIFNNRYTPISIASIVIKRINNIERRVLFNE